MRRHAAQCPVCGPELRALEATLRAFREAPRASARVDLGERVLSRLREQGLLGVPDPREPARAFLGMAAAALVVFLLVHTAPHDRVPRARPAAPSAASLARSRAAAIRWLCSVQEQDGSWSSERWGGEARFDVGVTGLGLLALVSEGQAGGQAAVVLDRGVRHLLRVQTPSGRIGGGGSGHLYNHAPAALALLEVALRHDRPRLLSAVRRSIEYVESLQHESGGWGYGGPDHGPANAMISAFPLKLLVRAREAGMQAEVKGPLRRARSFFAALRGADGRMGYRRPGDHPYETGTLAALSALEARSRRADVVLSAGTGVPSDLLGLYFRLAAEPTASPASSRLIALLDASQVSRGPLAGSFSPRDPWAGEGGRVYSTSMALLALREVEPPPGVGASSAREESR